MTATLFALDAPAPTKAPARKSAPARPRAHAQLRGTGVHYGPPYRDPAGRWWRDYLGGAQRAPWERAAPGAHRVAVLGPHEESFHAAFRADCARGNELAHAHRLELNEYDLERQAEERAESERQRAAAAATARAAEAQRARVFARTGSDPLLPERYPASYEMGSITARTAAAAPDSRELAGAENQPLWTKGAHGALAATRDA